MDGGDSDTALGARIRSVAETFALGRFHPASVQRDYQWEERHVQELFSDLERGFAAGEAIEDDSDAPGAAEEGAADAAAL